MKKTNDTPMEDFQALYNRQVNRVYRLALVMLGSQSDAEDMVQMVFLKVWEKKISFRDTDHETAWILTATKNQCKDVLKSYERKHCGTLEEMPEPGIASENHMENVVWLALESLEPKYRILLYLYYYEGYSIRELTAILKRKESTLQTQLAAGRRKKSFWRHWICRQWTAIILIPTVSIPVRCCRKTRYIFLMRKRNSSQRRCMCMILKRLMYHPRFP